MLRKVFFYSNVIVASIILPIIGIGFTVCYTVFFVSRALARAVLAPFQPRRLAHK